MKAIFKPNGEVIEVTQIGNGTHQYDLKDVEVVYGPDYWEQLRHQAAISAMHGIMSNPVGFESLRYQHAPADEKAAELAVCFANKLIKALKLSRSN